MHTPVQNNLKHIHRLQEQTKFSTVFQEVTC